MNAKVKYWIELSDYDLETAIVMLNTRGLYVSPKHRKGVQSLLQQVKSR